MTSWRSSWIGSGRRPRLLQRDDQADHGRVAGHHRSRHGDDSVNHDAVHPVEAIVDPLKFDSGFVEASVDAPAEFIEAAVDFIEAAVYVNAKVVQPLVGPALPHRLHDVILEDNAFRFGRLKLNS